MPAARTRHILRRLRRRVPSWKSLTAGWSGSELRQKNFINYDHEKVKDYPARYPMNKDSIGIETVAKYTEATKTTAAAWEAPTTEQSTSISRIVGILKKNYGISEKDIYEHDKISYKTPGEGAGLYGGDDESVEPSIVPPRSP